MKREILEVYRRYIPSLTPTEDGYFGGKCPWCGGDRFEVGLCNIETGEPSDYVCPGCGQEGTVEEFITQVKVSQIKDIEESELEGFSQHENENSIETEEEESEIEVEKSNVSSDMRIGEKILGFLALDLPTRELQIFLYLQIRGCEISAKEISEELQIPEKNVHRYLAGLEKKHLIYSGGKPKRFLRIEDSSLMERFKRKLHPQN